MLNDLIKMAGQLDALGLRREADFTDKIIRKVAQETPEGEPESKPEVEPESEVSLENTYKPSDYWSDPDQGQKDYDVTTYPGYKDMVDAWVKGDENKFSWRNEQSKKFGKPYISVALEILAKKDGYSFITMVLFSKQKDTRQVGMRYMHSAIASSSKTNPQWTWGALGYLKENAVLTEDEYNKYYEMTTQEVRKKQVEDHQKEIARHMKVDPWMIVYKYNASGENTRYPQYCTEEQMQDALLAIAEQRPEMIDSFVGYGNVPDEIIEAAIRSYDWTLENGTDLEKWHLKNGRRPEVRKNIKLKTAKRR